LCPSGTPIASAIAWLPIPTIKEMRAPYATRLQLSRPSGSVPMMCCQLDASSGLKPISAYPDEVSSGAKSATVITRIRNTSEAIASRFRRSRFQESAQVERV
jgi:hypothetical protein